MGEFTKDPGGGMGMYDPGVGWKYNEEPGTGWKTINDPRTGV
ncbi:hypothetical protein [Bacillus cytotoxicus]